MWNLTVRAEPVETSGESFGTRPQYRPNSGPDAYSPNKLKSMVSFIYVTICEELVSTNCCFEEANNLHANEGKHLHVYMFKFLDF